MFRWLFFASLMVVSLGYGQEPNPDQAQRQLEEHLSGFQTFSGDFEQKVTDESGRVLQSLDGHLTLSKPLRFHWRTQEPFAQLVLSDGETLWVYDEDLEQVIIRDLDQVQAMPAVLLSGSVSELSEHYHVEFSGRDGEQQYRLRPKQSNEGDFETLALLFRGDQLQSLELQDALGQTTLLTFSEVASNTLIDAELFRFDLRDGLDVIDERRRAQR